MIIKGKYKNAYLQTLEYLYTHNFYYFSARIYKRIFGEISWGIKTQITKILKEQGVISIYRFCNHHRVYKIDRKILEQELKKFK